MGPWRSALKESIPGFFDYFADVLRACPDDVWTESMWDVTKDPHAPAAPVLPDGRPHPSGVQLYSQFWYVAFHALSALDCNFALRSPSWRPPAPFDEQDPYNRWLLDRVYTREELLAYMPYLRDKAFEVLDAIDDDGNGLQGSPGLDAGRSEPINWARPLLGNMGHAAGHVETLEMFTWQRRK